MIEKQQKFTLQLRALQIGKYYPPDEGGVETVTRDLAEGLAHHGVQSDVLCFSRQSKYPPLNEKITVYRSQTLLRIANKSVSVDYVNQVRRLSGQYDVGLLHMPNPIGMLACNWFWRKPLVLLWHSDIVTYARIRGLLRGAELHLAKSAAAVIAPTPAHVDGSYLADMLRPKSVIGPYPFSDSRLKNATGAHAAASLAQAFARGRKIILAVGRLVPYKGFDVLIKAARMLDSNAVICIAGRGPLLSQLQEQIVACQLQDTVLMLGRVEENDLRELYEHVHVVTMPSVTRAEMYGMTQVEAMSFGKPVVSTDIPHSGVPWVNRHNVSGLVVPPGDVSKLAEALNRLITNADLYTQLSQGASAHFKQAHNLKAAAEVYANTLKRAARKI